jgi:hypothetical protein
VLWGSVEGRLMAMLEAVNDLTLATPRRALTGKARATCA